MSFYEIACSIVGQVPVTLNWLYDITTVLLIITSILIVIIPLSLVFKSLIGMR